MPPADRDREFLTPADVAELLGLAKLDSVYALIHSGALAAVNVSPSGGRPLWRITRAALDQFVAARSTRPAPAAAAKRKAKGRPKATAYF